MKKIAVSAGVILAILVVISFTKDMIVKTAVEKGVEAVTGLRLTMGRFSVGIIRTLIDIRNLRLFNPTGYKDRTMLNMPEIYIDYDPAAMFSGRIHLTEARLDLKEFVVVKNEDGELNLNSLKVVKAQKKGKRAADEARAKIPPIQIDSLRLKIGKVIYKDYSKGPAPSVREFNVNLDEKYSNIKDPYSLVSLIVVKALADTTIAGLADFDLEGLQGTISDTLNTAKKVAGKVITKAEETVQRAGEVAKKTEDAVLKTTKALEDIFKGSFGQKE